MYLMDEIFLFTELTVVLLYNHEHTCHDPTLRDIHKTKIPNDITSVVCMATKWSLWQGRFYAHQSGWRSASYF